MIKPFLILCSDELIQDASSKKISVINIFDEINSAIYPAVHHGLAILVRINRRIDDSRHCLLQIILKIEDDTILSHDINIDFAESIKHDAIVRIGTLALPRPGILKVNAKVNQENLSTQIFLKRTE